MSKIRDTIEVTLEQACQTGGPIACPMRPAAILLDLKIMLIK